jgi:hypothetical protein
MSRAWLVCALLIGCFDKAKPDYDRCVERDQNYDVPGAYSACAAAVAMDPKSLSGLAAKKKLDGLQVLVDKLQAERVEKDARDQAIKRDEPPPPVATIAATAVLPAVVVAPFDGGMGGPYFIQATALATSGDAAGARAILEPRVFGSGKAASDEVGLLKSICKAQKDKSCLKVIASKYR